MRSDMEHCKIGGDVRIAWICAERPQLDIDGVAHVAGCERLPCIFVESARSDGFDVGCMSPGSLAWPSGLRGIDDGLLLRPVICGRGEPQHPRDIGLCLCRDAWNHVDDHSPGLDDVILRSVPGTCD